MFDRLKVEAAECGIEIIERPFKSMRLKGLYIDNVITLNSASISDRIEKTCVLAEEIGHHHTSYGIILDQSDIRARKQELRARSWAYERLVPLTEIVRAYKARVKGRYEIAEYLEVTEEFLDRSIRRYQERYGLYAPCDDWYIIYFEPLGVVEIFV
jgi:hypothetical protein